MFEKIQNTDRIISLVQIVNKEPWTGLLWTSGGSEKMNFTVKEFSKEFLKINEKSDLRNPFVKIELPTTSLFFKAALMSSSHFKIESELYAVERRLQVRIPFKVGFDKKIEVNGTQGVLLDLSVSGVSFYLENSEADVGDVVPVSFKAIGKKIEFEIEVRFSKKFQNGKRFGGKISNIDSLIQKDLNHYVEQMQTWYFSGLFEEKRRA